MKYTIKEINPVQIKVEFEDESWAMVAISPDASPEEIDNAVAQFDPDFRPKPESLINNNISVGEERISKKAESPLPAFDFKNLNVSPQVNVSQDVFNTQNLGSNEIQPMHTHFGISDVAEYFNNKGDNRLKNAINQRIQTYVSQENFSIDELVSRYTNLLDNYPIAPDINPKMDNSSEYIVKQAEEELNAEQS